MVAAAVPSGRPGHLLVFTDSVSNQQFLVDTGSAYSIIPHQSSAPPSGPSVMAADRTSIPCWGRHVRTLNSSKRNYTWPFLKAALAFPILGADFLDHFNFMVDLRRKRLVRPDRSYTTASASTAQQPQAASLCARPPAAVISTAPPAGGAQQPQAASLCARPPVAVISQQPAGVVQQP